MSRSERDSARRESADGSPILSAARDTFARGQFEITRTLLRAAIPATTHEAGETALLLARASSALGDDDAAFAAATQAAQNLGSGPSLASALAMRAIAARALGKIREAKASSEAAANEVAKFSGAAGAIARLDVAREAYEGADFARAEALLKENVAAGVEEAAGIALLGWIEIKRDRYVEAANAFSSALRKLTTSGSADIALEARTLGGLATVAAEMGDLRALERVRKGAAKAALPESLRSDRFAILCGLRYASLLENDLKSAFFEAREATSAASTPAERALAETNAAVTSALLGDRNAEKLHFARAWNMLRVEKFAANDLAARHALLAFIAEASLAMPAEGRKAMVQYRGLVPKPGVAFTSDRRLLAFEALASARVSDALADEISAERFYQKAFDLFVALKLDMRAALVALDLRRITGDDAYVAAIDTALERAPGAWFGVQLAAQDGPLERLSPAELIVLAHLLRGETAKAIGEKLGRSPFTISNHTRRIFQAFEVNSRSKVISICAELGVTPELAERLAR